MKVLTFIVLVAVACGCTKEAVTEAPIVNPGYTNGTDGSSSAYTPWFVEDGVPNGAGEKAR